MVYVWRREEETRRRFHIPYVEFFDTVLIFELHLHKEVESFRRVINNEDLRQWGSWRQEL